MAPLPHPSLVWPRSDGDPSEWPQHKQPGNSGWFIKLPRDDANRAGDLQKMKLYRDKIGKFVATEILNIHVQNPWIELPDGYALFVHCKPRPDGSMREDVYMFGSTVVLKFRSPQEFVEHARWLFNTKLPLDDHSNCGCQYNKKSAIAKAKKRSADSGSPEPKRFKALPPEHADYDPVVPERAIDTHTKRRFRKGELVFFRIPTISPPAGSGLPEITHWPGLVASITHRLVTSDENGVALGSANAAWAIAGGKAPAALERRTIAEHHIRPLGMFSTSQDAEVVRRTSEILPWAVSEEIFGGPSGWDRIGKESSRVIRGGVEHEARVDIPSRDDLTGSALDGRWKQRWGERIAFKLMPSNWDFAILRLATALKTAKIIAGSWSQTDKMEVLPPGMELTEEDVQAIKNREKTLFQGVWFQGERIWVDDMVRLRKNRKDLPTDDLLPPSEGAEDRGVFMNIRNISLEVYNEPDATPSEQDMWRCLLYGDIYELASSGPSDAPTHEAPKGLYYRRLNDASRDVTVDIFDIAGRAYPDLLEKDSTWFHVPGVEKADRVEAGETVLALVGLRPGDVGSRIGGQNWKEDLYVMVRDATQGVEREFREHYARLLSSALRYNTTPQSSSSHPANTGTGSPVTTSDQERKPSISMDVSNDSSAQGARPGNPNSGSTSTAGTDGTASVQGGTGGNSSSLSRPTSAPASPAVPATASATVPAQQATATSTPASGPAVSSTQAPTSTQNGASGSTNGQPSASGPTGAAQSASPAPSRPASATADVKPAVDGTSTASTSDASPSTSSGGPAPQNGPTQANSLRTAALSASSTPTGSPATHAASPNPGNATPGISPSPGAGSSSASTPTVVRAAVAAPPLPKGQQIAAAHAVMVLPFTPALLANPETILKMLYGVVQHGATENLTVVFSTPNSEVQLYTILLASPRTYFALFQRFLARVYTVLIRGQTVSKRIGLGVEVHFDGELGNWADKVPQTPTRIFKFLAYPSLARHIIKTWPEALEIALNTPPDIPKSGSLPPPATPSHFAVGAVGGSFDHLHGAHKLLLHMALFTVKDRLVVGVTTDKLLQRKPDRDLIQPLDERMEATKAFLARLGQSNTKIDMVALEDPAGPTARDPEIEALTVSTETLGGAAEVNKLRQWKGLKPLVVLPVDVIKDLDYSQQKAVQVKFGSSTIRAWLAKKAAAAEPDSALPK